MSCDLDATDNVQYVHVADDGGLFAIDAEGRSAWVTEAEVSHRLARLCDAGGSLILSWESGSSLAKPVLTMIHATGAEVIAASEVHPDAIRQESVTALMAAAYAGVLPLVEDLLRRGAEVDIQDDEGYNALMYASNAGEVEVVRMLINEGADLDLTDRDGTTALMFGAQHGHDRVVKKLLAAGADLSARRKIEGFTAWQFAEANGHTKVLAMLEAAAHQP